MPHKDPKKKAAYQQGYHKEWYANNRKARIAQVKARKVAIRDRYRAFKESLACSRCGLSGKDNSWALEFHHRNPADKIHLVSYMVSHGTGWDKILAEIEKCDVVCASCHRQKHYQEHLKDGEDSMWVKAGQHGSEGRPYTKDEVGRIQKRKVRRRKQRQDREKNRADGNPRSGPAPTSQDDIDTYLLKIENGVGLNDDELARFRRLIGRQEAGRRMAGQKRIEADTDLDPDKDCED